MKNKNLFKKTKKFFYFFCFFIFFLFLNFSCVGQTNKTVEKSAQSTSVSNVTEVLNDKKTTTIEPSKNLKEFLELFDQQNKYLDSLSIKDVRNYLNLLEKNFANLNEIDQKKYRNQENLLINKLQQQIEDIPEKIEEKKIILESQKDILSVDLDKLKELGEKKQNNSLYFYPENNDELVINPENYVSAISKKTKTFDLINAIYTNNKQSQNDLNCYQSEAIFDYVPSQIYKDSLDSSFAVKFYDNNKRFVSGTLSILDYKIENDNAYPTKWFFITNAHVAKNLRNKFNRKKYQYPDSFNWKENYYVEITRFNYSITGLEKKSEKIPVNTSDAKTWTFSNQALINKSVHGKLPTNIFLGTDFLDSKPIDFNSQFYNPDLEEFIDIGILEFNFATPQAARDATSNYANWPDEKKFKYVQKNLFDYKNDANKMKVFLLGFPKHKDLITPTFNAKNGTNLSDYVYNQTFLGYPGILDLLSSLPAVYIDVYGKKYKISGLGISYLSGNLGPGSSGSRIFDQQKNILAFHFSSWNNSTIGLGTLLFSKQYKIKNSDSFYVPGYDVIYGNVLGQKNSYIQELKEVYAKENIKTFIFDKGINSY